MHKFDVIARCQNKRSTAPLPFLGGVAKHIQLFPGDRGKRTWAGGRMAGLVANFLGCDVFSIFFMTSL